MQKKLLILEDEVSMHDHLRFLSHKAGYDAIFATNGKVGLEILAAQATEIHCIILDYIMPVINGLEFLEEKQKFEAYQNIPVWMHTSCSPMDMAFQKALSYGWILGFLRKPFRCEELVEKVGAILQVSDNLVQ